MTDEEDIYPKVAAIWADVAIESLKRDGVSALAIQQANNITDAYIKRFNDAH